MDAVKIRLKIGEHEFEAEGPRESVELQLQMFKELVGSARSTPSRSPAGSKPSQTHDPSPDEIPPDPPKDYDKLFSPDGDRLSLHYLPEGDNREANAIILLLFGYRTLQSQETVLGGRLMQGLQQSGLTLDRIDRVLSPYMPSLVITSGIKKGTKYRLTNLGMQKAKTLAEEQLRIIG